MRKLFIPLILCLLLTFTFANFTAPSFEKQPLRISTTTDFFGSDKGIVTIDLNIENLEATTKEISNYDMLHLQNEIINYNITPLLFGVMLTMFLGFIYIGEKIEGAKQNE